MKTKLQFIALASLAVMGAGCLAVTAGVTANQSTQLSLNAETINDTVGYLRLWLSSDNNNKLSGKGNRVRAWFHENNSDIALGEGTAYFSSNTLINIHESNANPNREYYYVDVKLPENRSVIGTYLTVETIKDTGEIATYTDPVLIDNATKLSQVMYIYSAYGQRDCSQSAFGSLNWGTPELAAKALEGLQTCSSSDINGFNAFPTLSKTFFLNDTEWKITGDLGGETIMDYASIDDYATGERTIEVNAYQKAVILAQASGVKLH